MTDQKAAASRPEKFCAVPDPLRLAQGLGIEDMRIGHWHEAGEDHDERWRGWGLCIVTAFAWSDGKRTEYDVITQAAQPPDADLYVQQLPAWPEQPDLLKVEARQPIDGAAVAHYWDEARALFGLPIGLRGEAAETR